MGGDFPGRNFLGGSFPRKIHQEGRGRGGDWLEFSGWEFS